MLILSNSTWVIVVFVLKVPVGFTLQHFVDFPWIYLKHSCNSGKISTVSPMSRHKVFLKTFLTSVSSVDHNTDVVLAFLRLCVIGLVGAWFGTILLHCWDRAVLPPPPKKLILKRLLCLIITVPLSSGPSTHSHPISLSPCKGRSNHWTNISNSKPRLTKPSHVNVPYFIWRFILM